MLAEIMRGQLIERAVGNNMDNDEDDVRRIKRSLSLSGPFDFDTTPEPHGIVTREMDTAIRGLQSDEDLKVDGILRPGGETEGVLLDRVSKHVLEPFTNSLSSEKSLEVTKIPDIDRAAVMPFGQDGDDSNKKPPAESEPEITEDEKSKDKEQRSPPKSPKKPSKDERDDDKEKDHPDKDDKDKKRKKCQQLSIELQNEVLQHASLEADLTAVSEKVNAIFGEIEAAETVLIRARADQAMDTVVSGAGKGPLAVIGAGVAFFSKDGDVKAAKERAGAVRERWKGLKTQQENLNLWVSDTIENIKALEVQMSDLGC